jgi:hypothetical protein
VTSLLDLRHSQTTTEARIILTIEGRPDHLRPGGNRDEKGLEAP